MAYISALMLRYLAQGCPNLQRCRILIGNGDFLGTTGTTLDLSPQLVARFRQIAGVRAVDMVRAKQIKRLVGQQQLEGLLVTLSFSMTAKGIQPENQASQY